jgi:hypothetical protein
VGGFVEITAYTSGSVTLTVSYTDPSGTAKTNNLTAWLGSGDTQTLNTAGAYPLYSMTIEAKYNTVITVYATVTGTLTYSVGVWLAKVN